MTSNSALAEMPQSGQPMPAPQSTTGADPNPSDQAKGTADERQAAMSLSEEDKKHLLDVVKQFKQLWAMQRRQIVRKTLKRIEYLKGNQYISFDPSNFSFFDPFDTGVSGTQQDNDETECYHYVTNVVQWLHRVFISSLSAAIPSTRFWPGNAESDLDNRASQMASRANALIERQNKSRAMLKQCLAYLGLAGCYFRYTRWVFDERLGSKKEPQEAMQDQELMPDRFTCPACGEDTPANSTVMQAQPMCQSCGGPVQDDDFYPALRMPVPTVVGYEDVPQGRVKQSVYNSLHVDVAPYADESGADPLLNTPILSLAIELDKAAGRAMYPDDWDKFGSQTGEGSGNPDADIERLARLRAYSPGTARGLLSSHSMPTYTRDWIQPWAFNILDQQDDAKRLQQLFPKGVCVSSVSGQFLDCRPAELTKEWTWCGTTTGLGAYPPAVLEPAMDFQDRINDVSNTEHEYYDRLASPPIFYNPKMLSKGLNGRFLPAGSLIPLPVNLEMNRTMKDAFFQPEFKMDSGIREYIQNLLQAVQLLIGVTPQMYGGTQPNVDTAKGQEQALKVATGILWLYWDEVREEHAQAAKIGVKCLAENLDDDTYNVIEGDDGDYQNESIDLEALDGEFNAYPEADQGYPVGFEQMRELLQNMLIQGAKNPLIMEMFEPLKNRRMVARYLAPQDMEIPGEPAERKVLRDIAKLIKGQPIPGPMIPGKPPSNLPGDEHGKPLLPDEDFEDFDILEATVLDYAQKNCRMKDENPPAFENIRLYYRIAIEYGRMKGATSAMPVEDGGEPRADSPSGGPPMTGPQPIQPTTAIS